MESMMVKGVGWLLVVDKREEGAENFLMETHACPRPHQEVGARINMHGIKEGVGWGVVDIGYRGGWA